MKYTNHITSLLKQPCNLFSRFKPELNELERTNSVTRRSRKPHVWSPIAMALILSLISSCGPQLGLDPPPRDKHIGSVKWSPNGKKLAFLYQNNSPSNLFFHVYTINVDGTELQHIFQTNTKDLGYYLHQWASNEKILVGDYWNLYALDLKGKVQSLLALDSKSNPPQEIFHVCALPNSAFILINNQAQFPSWVDMLDGNTGKISTLKLENSSLFDHESQRDFKCSAYNNKVYFAASSYDYEKKVGKSVFAIGEVVPESGKVQSIHTFDPFANKPSQGSEFSTFQVLGWSSAQTLVYAFGVGGDPSTAVFEYDIQTKETKPRQDIKVLGSFSPDFKKVAFVDDIHGYLVISNLDGTEKKNLVSITSLPLGDLPL